MHRKKQIIYIAHCLLNQNAVIRDWERAQGAFNDIIKVLLEENISIIQLPCPEFIFLGENRPPKTKEEYDIPEYRFLCSRLAEGIVKEMKEYINNDYLILGLIGIQESPTCDIIGKRGIFMEELMKLMEAEEIPINSFDIPEKYMEGKSTEVVETFKNHIRSLLRNN